MNFSEKLQNLRIGKSLSQEELAEIMNVSRQSVSKWELGQSFPEIEKLIDISNYFGVSIDSLVKNEKTAVEDRASGGSQDNIPPFEVKKKAFYLIFIICIITCFINLSILYLSHNIYEVIIRGVLSILGIAGSLYGLRKLKKSMVSRFN